MSTRIQLGISIFFEANFLRKQVVGVIIIRIVAFTIVSIVGFDHVVVEIGDLDVNMQHAGFCI
jgi:hypothetical protein